MASKNQQSETTGKTAPQLFHIKELRDKKRIPASVFSGVCAAHGWKSGKMVTEDDFNTAVRKFSVSPIGRKVK